MSLSMKKSKPVITTAQYIDTPDAEAITESDEIPWDLDEPTIKKKPLTAINWIAKKRISKLRQQGTCGLVGLLLQ